MEHVLYKQTIPVLNTELNTELILNVKEAHINLTLSMYDKENYANRTLRTPMLTHHEFMGLIIKAIEAAQQCMPGQILKELNTELKTMIQQSDPNN